MAPGEYPNGPRARRAHADRPARATRPRRPGRAPREARVPEPGRLGEGPDRARDDRGGRAGRPAAAGRDDRRADLGQHRRRPRHRRRASRLPLHLRHARQDEPGEDLDAARIRRGGRDHADRRRSALARELLLRLGPARGGDPGRLQARPVLEPGEPRGALRDDRARALGADAAASIDAVVISVGTGGTITGVGRYFKERRPEVRIVAVDPEGSVFTADEEHPEGPYLVEGIGKECWPDTLDPEVVDEWVRVSDRDSFLTARRLAREEGLLVGGSTGSTAWAGIQVAKKLGPEARVLMMFPDCGPLVPVEVLRRQLDDPVRLPRADDAAAGGRGGAPLPARRPRGSRPRHDRLAREGRRGDRRDAALRDLAAPGRARRARRLARGRRRLAAGARAPRARVPERRRVERGRRRRHAAAAAGRRRRRVGRTRSTRGCRAGAAPSSSRAAAGRPGSSRGRTCWSSSPRGARRSSQPLSRSGGNSAARSRRRRRRSTSARPRATTGSAARRGRASRARSRRAGSRTGA